MTAAEHGLLAMPKCSVGQVHAPEPVCTDRCAAKERDTGQYTGPSGCCAALKDPQAGLWLPRLCMMLLPCVKETLQHRGQGRRRATRLS